MKYVVTIKQGGDEIKVEFSDSIRANMFAEMAAKGILPDTYYGTNEVKPVKVTIEFVPVTAEEPQEAPAEKNKEEQ